jgi:raffinose/stachyose/melibiose transport system permease protein
MNIGRKTDAPLLKHALLALFAIPYVYPIFWLLVNSFKTTEEIFRDPWGLPRQFQWSNYPEAWVTGKIGHYFLNSVLVTGGALAVLILLASMAAFAIARMRWRLSGVVLGLFTIGMMIPIHATLLPLFMFFSRLSLTNSRLALVFLYAAFGLPVAILILANFFRSFPREIEEAAAMDGCSMAMLFWKITLPMSRAALFTVLIFSFMNIWNELLVALVFISDVDRMTLPVGLMNFKGQYATNYAPLLAATILVIIPGIIVYSMFNNRIIEGMTAGALKG